MFRPFALLLVLVFASAVLGGCGSSPGAPRYQATGTWEGTLTDPTGVVHPIRALFAPNNTFRWISSDGTRIVAGTATVTENIGSGTVDLYTNSPTQLSMGGGRILFSLRSASTLAGYLLLDNGRWDFSLAASPEFAQSVALGELAGNWTWQSDRLIAQLTIDPAGNLAATGNECGYSGALRQPVSGNNLFAMTLVIDCPDGTSQTRDGSYTGLATLRMTTAGLELLPILIPGNGSLRVNIASWYSTVNQPPVANAGPDKSYTLYSGSPISLDGSASSDPNNDPLTYDWSVVASPGGVAVTLQNAATATPIFTPPVAGDYLLQLSVGDGELFSLPHFVTVTVTFTTDRFTDRGDGTILDLNSGLLWLKDAGCFPILDQQTNTSGWTGIDYAIEVAVPGLQNGRCGLTDSSNPGDWRLPTRNELMSLADTAYFAPALSNTAGNGQWTTGDPFINVFSAPYWCSDGDPASYDSGNNWYLLYYFVNLLDGSSDSMTYSTYNHIWPVRSP